MWKWLPISTARLKGDRRDRSVIIYTRVGCHLCEEACLLMERYGFSPEMIDIDADPALKQQYTNCVPVVVIDGKVRFRGRVNEVLLRRLLHASPPKA